MNIAGQKVTILGLGKSGLESARFLKKRGVISLFVSELQETESIQERRRELQTLGIEVETGHHSLERILESDLIILSPGISPKSDIYQVIEKTKIPIWSEIELAFCFSPARLIAVTGSNGKTTVTTLIAKVLAEQGIQAISCGNIGNPFIGEIEKLTPNSFAVVEVSSFQLQNIIQFKPSIAILLNVTDNHFDWHGTFDAYACAKWRIFENQDRNDYALINQDDPESVKRVSSIRSQVVYFDQGKFQNPNFTACLKVAELCKLNHEKALETIQNFRGIEHRLEEILSLDGVCYINDAKSTTIASLQWALERTQDKVILIMGGRHKGGDFGVLRKWVAKKVSFLILLGESASHIQQVFGFLVPSVHVSSLPEAVRCARKHAKPGDTVLFSPACASFDMFHDYQDRGRQFKKLVSELQQSEPQNVPVASPKKML